MKNYQVLDPDWDKKKKNVLSPLMVFLKEFLSKVDFEKKIQQTTKKESKAIQHAKSSDTRFNSIDHPYELLYGLSYFLSG